MDKLYQDNKRIDFTSKSSLIDYPHLLAIQRQSFHQFFCLGTKTEEKKNENLYKLFKEKFPIKDSKNNLTLDFIDYTLDPPKHSPKECIHLGITYAVTLKVRLQLLYNDIDQGEFKKIEKSVFFGNIPYITDQCSFVVNGIERAIVSQLHRSPGVFFTQNKHANGTTLHSARIIPAQGSWIEFATDAYHIMYAYIERKKKIPITTLLRVIGYDTDQKILTLFSLAEEVNLTKKNIKKYLGRKFAGRVLKSWVEDFVDEETGEVIPITRKEIIIERDEEFTEEHIEKIQKEDIKKVLLKRNDIDTSDYALIYNTLIKDPTNNEKEAVEYIYRQVKNIDPPDEQTAYEIVNNIFFSNRKYDLGEAGRYKINKKLKLNTPNDARVLSKEDIIAIVRYLIDLKNAKVSVDDIDHLGNRRVRTVGEQIYNQFSIGLSRMSRIIQERLEMRDIENLTPSDLINARSLISAINTFFATNPLSQFMDQVNPLAEVTHKRRISALGPGGLSKDRAGFEVRDIHYTHYGRLCTIETPEGPNIGLISSLCLYAKINSMGFIETPYKKVKEGTIDMQDTPVYMTAEDEISCNIAQFNSPTNGNFSFVGEKIKARKDGDLLFIEKDDINYTDVAPNQIVSVAAALIPFLEHDDPSRALMGSNMQRQAVPLLYPEAPIVGTGLEKHVAQDFEGLIKAEKDGVVTYVDAKNIIIEYNVSFEEKIASFNDFTVVYSLDKFRKTNQETCINLKPIVSKGDRVYAGQVLCEGYATQRGELALGKNLQVAFMSWQGYNFEDAIVISERVVKEDIFTSLHIEEFSIDIRDTKIGQEEFTAEIPSLSEVAIKNLDENGMVKIGTRIKPGDILIGKITPREKLDVKPEEKLLEAIFGPKAGNVKDNSLIAPASTEGTVIDIKLFTNKYKKEKITRKQIKKEVALFAKKYAKELIKLRIILVEKLDTVLQGKKSLGVYHNLGEEIIGKGILFNQEVLMQHLFPSNNSYVDEKTYAVPEEADFIHDIITQSWVEEEEKNVLIAKILDNYQEKKSKLGSEFKRKKFNLEVGDELPAGIIQLAKLYVIKKRKLKVGDKMAGRHGNKGVVSKVVREEDMPFLEDGTPIDIILNPLGVPSRMNLGQIYETVLGWAGLKLNEQYKVPIFAGATIEQINHKLVQAKLPSLGRTDLYDGISGKKFDQKVTVGVIYMLKLNHLIEDKMHARSIGPYSLITQQPLGGKSQFGGQRVGEMEVWALEAYGAAHILQEMLTVKSDDIEGRRKTYEALVKGENTPIANPPESFNVLINELRSLGLSITF